MFVKIKLHKKVIPVYPWTNNVCPVPFIVTHEALPRYAKRSSEKTNHPLPHPFETVIPNQRLFSCCQSCRDSTSRSAKVESKRCGRCKEPLSRFFVAPDNMYNLAISFNFSITNGQISAACRHHAALNLSHSTHFGKRSPEQSCDVHRSGSLL